MQCAETKQLLFLQKTRHYEPVDETCISQTCCVECKSGRHLMSWNLL